MEIRPGRPEDVPAVADLMRQLAEFEKLPPPDAAAEARLASHAFPGDGQVPLVELWVAERAGEVVAYAAIFLAYSTFRARPTLYLEDLYVRADARRAGIGTAMLSRLREEATARGCGRFEWSVLDWNTPSIEFYESRGAVPQEGWTVFRVTGEALERLARAA
jgi:GNAT superfamily N-acetyltransferase